MTDTRIYDLLRRAQSGDCTATELDELAQLRIEAADEVELIEQVIEHTHGLTSEVEDVSARWDALSTRLDEVNPTAQRRRKTWPLLLALALLLGLVGLAYWWAQRETATATRVLADSVLSRTLPDGSVGYTGHRGSIVNRSTYGQKDRALFVKGEVYIDAETDEMPMIVNTERFKIEVMGTRFNIMDYMREPGGSISLYEGSLKVTLPDSRVVEMSAGQHLFWTQRKQEYSIQPIDKREPGWLSGQFTFDNTPFEEVMLRLSRVHKVEITGIEALSGRHFTDKMTDPSLEAVFKRIEKVANVRIIKINDQHHHIQKR